MTFSAPATKFHRVVTRLDREAEGATGGALDCAGKDAYRWFMRLFVAIAFLFLAGCDKPFGFIPGRALDGNEVPPPQDWSEINKTATVQLEFRPGKPYSINIWAVAIDRDMYVATGEDGTRWTEYLQETPLVRVRVNESIYPLNAVRIVDAAEHRTVTNAFISKYNLDKDNWVVTGQVFRLDRRTMEAQRAPL